MGRKRTAEEKRRYAEDNGFNDDDTDVDDNPIPRDVLDYTKERYDVQIELWLEGPLKKKLGLSMATRPRTYLTLENYMYIERQLWQSDGHEYVHDGYRVLISAKLKCHVFTSARIGEISEGSTRRGTGKGLRYKDTEMLVAWKDGEPELRYSLKREFAKGMHDKEQQRPTHILYEHVPDQPLIVNPILFMLAIFLAAGAFKKYDTIEQVLAVKPPTDQKYWVLEWADHVHALDLPVFPEMSPDGLTQKIQSASAFCTQVRKLSLRAGMEQPVTVHGIRRESLIQATSNGYSKDELMKFAAHTNQMTMTRDYLSSITVVDGLGGFLKLPLRSDQAEDFRSMTVKRNPELFLSLPAKTQDELRQREDHVAITTKLEDLSFETNAETRTAIRNQLLKQRRMLEKEELNRVRSTQDRAHPAEREGKGKYHVDQDRSWFDRLRHMMPERERLSHALFSISPLRSPEGVSAIKDLLSLLKSNCRVAYQPSLRPRQGKCPVPHCGVDLEQ
ncbi:hypothetical protein B0H67DRAFT_495372 [Lasiosphaeris hirsuta]|uniref:Uncharacterized protein n=1 Tax=Lasiosphaeris hirsuta TaxID=260670 RepID=A0AA40A214_9PEZI|nr:hypothetical protein B0H67DRAFT_495372 [Lasiosphaeris hirsuta]